MLSSAYSAMAVCYYFPYEKTGDLKDLKRVIEMCKKAVALSAVSGQVSSMFILGLAESCQLLSKLSQHHSGNP
jgi:hypothetical protein